MLRVFGILGFGVRGGCWEGLGVDGLCPGFSHSIGFGVGAGAWGILVLPRGPAEPLTLKP